MQNFNPNKPALGALIDPDEMRDQLVSLFTSNSGTNQPVAYMPGTLWFDQNAVTMRFHDGVSFTSITKNAEHGLLAGLTIDDHLQYVHNEGLRGYKRIVSESPDSNIDDVHTTDFYQANITGNLLFNGTFDGATQSYWTPVNSPNISFVSSSEFPGYAIAISGDLVGIAQSVTGASNRTYSLVGWMRAVGGGIASMELSAGSVVKTVSYDVPIWQAYALTITSVHNLPVTVRLFSSTSTGQAEFDNVSLCAGTAPSISGPNQEPVVRSAHKFDFQIFRSPATAFTILANALTTTVTVPLPAGYESLFAVASVENQTAGTKAPYISATTPSGSNVNVTVAVPSADTVNVTGNLRLMSLVVKI